MISIDPNKLIVKKRKLEEVRILLKQEFFGIDNCIDLIITSIQTWYLMPEILIRPPIICLFGLTGVGKTALIRSLVNHLEFENNFLEIQMDGFNNSSTTDIKTISGLISSSGIEEGKPGIILLDEFQRYRTLDEKGQDIKLERYSDVWMLLSDGKFPSDYSKLQKMIEWIDMQDYWVDSNKYNDAYNEAIDKEEPGKEIKRIKFKHDIKYERKFFIMRDEAEEMKRMLRLNVSIREIMTWDKDKIKDLIRKKLESNRNEPFDYSKCLIFVSGNLDEAFKISNDVEDCDTSADVFYQHSLKVGITEIKTALSLRFRPEQIARLGNNHIIYPSLSKYAYKQIIKRSCSQYIEQATKLYDIKFTVDDCLYQEIYDNSVYPAQGTRPVFTSINKLFGSPLADCVLWTLENGLKEVNISLDTKTSYLVFRSGEKFKHIKVDFDIRARRKSRSKDFNSLVAVHEAGHAIIYAELFRRPPIEVAINVASFKGGYNLFNKEILRSKSEMLDMIAVKMGGIIAEELIFGPDLRSNGCASDVSSATSDAGMFIRKLAMDGNSAYISEDSSGLYINNVNNTDEAIENIIITQKQRAQVILTTHRKLLIELSKELLLIQKMDKDLFFKFINNRIPIKNIEEQDINNDYASRLEKITE